VHHDEVLEAFRNYLRENDLPITAQRLAIADIVLGSGEHLSAEEIMIELGARGAYAGTATVYRTLELMLRSGLAVERDFGEGFKRFEAARGNPNHSHLHCGICGRIVEFSEQQLDEIAARIATEHGFTRESHRFVIAGLCNTCRSDGKTGSG
jgi:Fur family ferric uptake transcriptional regulator